MPMYFPLQVQFDRKWWIHFSIKILNLGCKKWDACAPEAIRHAMGGKHTDMKGNSYEYHEKVFLTRLSLG